MNRLQPLVDGGKDIKLKVDSKDRPAWSKTNVAPNNEEMPDEELDTDEEEERNKDFFE